MDAKRKYLLLLLLIGSLVFLFKLGGRDLWDPDEPRYAAIAREMRQSGDWIAPHLHGQIYLEKPPLFFWLVNLSTFAFGNSELANRLPSGLAGLAVVVLTFILGSRLFGPEAGFLSGLVLASGFYFPQISRWMMLDSLLTLCFLLSLAFLYFGLNRPERQRTYSLLAGVCMACGILAKGPLAYLPVPLMLIYTLMSRDFRKIWNRNLLYSVLLSVGVVFVWFLPAVNRIGESYGTDNLWLQTVGYFIGGRNHPEPLYLYFARFPFDFLPWTLFLPWAFVSGYRQIKSEKRKEVLFLFVWFAFLFLFFSLSKAKKENYLLPLYPAAALGLGNWLAPHWRSSGKVAERLDELWIPVMLITLLSVLAGAIILLSPVGWFPATAVSFFPYVLGAISCILVGGALSLLFALKRRQVASISCFIAGLIAAHVYVSTVFIPWINPARSAKPFSQEILRRMTPGDELKIWKFRHQGILYYTGKPVEQIKKIDRLLEVLSGPGRVFVVAEEQDLAELNERTALLYHVIEKRKVAHQMLFLISNKARSRVSP